MTLLAWRWSHLSLVAATALLALVVRVGSDWGWAAAMGTHITDTGSVPDHVPFASAPSSGWHNVPVLGEVLASVLAQGGPAVVVLAHLCGVLCAFLILLVCARRLGASDERAALFLSALVLGALSSWGLVRLQSYSLPLFAAMLALVVTQSRHPDRRLWLAPVLVAVWGNLHGAVLLGVCVLGAYLVLDRMRHRPVEAVGVGAASLVALLCTPQGIHTVDYYASVFHNEAADRGEGLWATVDPTQPFDALMLVALAVLGGAALRHRRRAWEYVAVAGCAAATVSAARHGVWLLCLLFLLASARPPEEPVAVRPGRVRGQVLVALALSLAVAVPVVLVRGDGVDDTDPDLVAAVLLEAGDRVILAPAPLVESLAEAGAQVWAGNPLDAFEGKDQEAYLDFLAGRPGMQRAVEGSQLVVTQDGTPAGDAMARMTGLEGTQCHPGWTCHLPREGP